jgi:AraC family transcriptional regulator
MVRVWLHIQQHLDEPLTVSALARVACFSPFHFHRLFAALTGETLSAHVRRLRLERTAFQLRHTRQPVTRIGLDAGYNTPAAFSKAFQQHFGVAPSTYRQQPHIQISMKHNPTLPATGLPVLKPQFVQLPERRVVFVRRVGGYAQAAETAWTAVCQFAYSRRLVEEGRLFIGISHDSPDITPEDQLRYDACITVNRPVKPEGEVGVQIIPGGSYAVFLHRGPHAGLNDTYNAIFGQWLPASGRQLREQPCFEVYLNAPGRTKPANLKTQIHVPLK